VAAGCGWGRPSADSRAARRHHRQYKPSTPLNSRTKPSGSPRSDSFHSASFQRSIFMAHAAAPAPAATWRRRVGIMLGSLIDQRHVEAHRRLDEIERKLDQMLGRATDPRGHRLFGTPGQSSAEGLIPSANEGLRAIQAEANLLAGPCSGRHYLLTAPRQFGILQFGPGWRGTECNSTN
jgi:hypothetical protein